MLRTLISRLISVPSHGHPAVVRRRRDVLSAESYHAKSKMSDFHGAAVVCLHFTNRTLTAVVLRDGIHDP
ncbi:hypothetical protein THIOKS1620010 [Thiocapsa sp. KS1]|nr:hypothetical protein THIOKS1620010 [Thiocapsa sp. KS1]